MSSQAQQFNRVFDCMTCGKPIKLARKGDNSGWEKFETDGVTPHTHNHPSSKKQQYQKGGSSSNVNLELLVMQVRDEVRSNFTSVNSKLDKIQAELAALALKKE